MTDQNKKKRGRPAGAGRFTSLEDDKTLRLLAAGLTVAEVAKVLGRGRATVYKRLVEMRAEPLLPLHEVGK